jgi:GTP cyclohydrolase II
VYNTRKRQEGGDSAENYFACTEQVAGVQDTRFQALMPDPLHFLGGKSYQSIDHFIASLVKLTILLFAPVTKIHNFISMSDMKYNAIVSTGIEIVNRVEIPKELVPDDAQVEITAKVFHGYNAGKAYQGIDENELKKTVGREYAY